MNGHEKLTRLYKFKAYSLEMDIGVMNGPEYLEVGVFKELDANVRQAVNVEPWGWNGPTGLSEKVLLAD